MNAKTKTRLRTRRSLAGATLLLGLVAAQTLNAPFASAGGGYPYDSATPCGYSAWCISGNEYSPYSYAYRNCTDWVAYKLDSLGVPATKYKYLGNAKNWGTNAATKGVTVNGTPAKGSAAIKTSGDYGHVAYVESVNGDGTITVSQYNTNYMGAYSTQTGTPASMGFTQFAHFEAFMPGGATSTPPSGPVYENIQHVYTGAQNGKVAETYIGTNTSLTTGQYYTAASPIADTAMRRSTDGTVHLYSATKDGKVYETYWGGGNSLTTWQMADLGEEITKIAVDITSDGVQHVYSGTASGKIYETYIGGGNSLTTGLLANVGSRVTGMATYRTGDNVNHVFSSTTSGKISETYWGGGNSLTTYQLVNVGEPVASISFEVTQNGTNHVYTGTSVGHVKDTYWGGGNSLTTWQMADLGSSVNSMDSNYS